VWTGSVLKCINLVIRMRNVCISIVVQFADNSLRYIVAASYTSNMAAITIVHRMTSLSPMHSAWFNYQAVV